MSSAAPEREHPEPSTGENTVPSTGESTVDEALEPLANLPDADLDRHVAVFDEVHRRLAAALGSAGEDSAARPG